MVRWAENNQHGRRLFAFVGEAVRRKPRHQCKSTGLSVYCPIRNIQFDLARYHVEHLLHFLVDVWPRTERSRLHSPLEETKVASCALAGGLECAPCAGSQINPGPFTRP